MSLPVTTRRTRLSQIRGGGVARSRMNPFNVHKYAHGSVAEVPDPIDFIVSDKYLDRPNLYPRQATFIKIIFLRDDLFTQYDHDVIGEWEQTFLSTGTEGLNPGIYDRIRINKAQGRPWFRETQAVVGRRGSKGYTGALAGSYVLWNYMHRPGGPQAYYGIDRDKRLTGIVFAGKKEQARANQWQDLVNVITGGPCFSPYISRQQTERLTIFAPTDIIRAERQASLGVVSDADPASFEIIPAPSTTMAARGPTSFCLDPSTPVLTADLRWVPIGDVRPGDWLVGLDEFPERPNAQRKMRETEVLHAWSTRSEALRLTFEDGTSVVCSKNHRWLTRDKGKSGATKWRKADRLNLGSHIKWIADPWEEEQTREAGYLAGFFDGEGCVSGWSERAGKAVLFSQNDGAVLDEVKRMLDQRGYDLLRYNSGRARCQQWALVGSAQAMRFLGSIRPLRLTEKSRGVWEGVAPRGGVTRTGRIRPNGFKTITGIEELPEQDLVDIETTTRTFLANGLVSHNCQFYDEQAHVISSTSNADAGQVYDSATPALDQFKKDGFIYSPSSPWTKQGKFFENWERAIEMEPDGSPTYPERLMLQLPSWGPYEDWEEAHHIPLKPPTRTVVDMQVEVKKRKTVDGKQKTVTVLETQQVEMLIPGPTFKPLKKAIQAYDDDMRQLERANPDTFKVERRSIWAESLSAYLNPDKVDAMFAPWDGERLFVSTQGILSRTYSAHGDPANSNKRFGWSFGHRVWVPKLDPDTGLEIDGEGMWHVVFDNLRCWEPADYEDHTLDYEDVMGDIWTDVKTFVPEDVSFDQFNVPATIGWLRKKLAKEQLPKSVTVHEVSRTRALNWKHAELFKSALNMGLIHAPMHKQQHDASGGWEVNYASDEGRTELKFLEEKNGAVDHPTSGPVQTKDIADTMMEVVVQLIGRQMATLLGQEFDGVGLSGTAPRGTDPSRHTRTKADDLGDRLGGTMGNTRGARWGNNQASRGGMRRR